MGALVALFIGWSAVGLMVASCENPRPDPGPLAPGESFGQAECGTRFCIINRSAGFLYNPGATGEARDAPLISESKTSSLAIDAYGFGGAKNDCPYIEAEQLRNSVPRVSDAQELGEGRFALCGRKQTPTDGGLQVFYFLGTIEN